MFGTLWCGQLTRLSGGVGARGTKIGIAAPPARTAKHAPLIDALTTVYGTFKPFETERLVA
jgi:hypothetical protein